MVIYLHLISVIIFYLGYWFSLTAESVKRKKAGILCNVLIWFNKLIVSVGNSGVVSVSRYVYIRKRGQPNATSHIK